MPGISVVAQNGVEYSGKLSGYQGIFHMAKDDIKIFNHFQLPGKEIFD